MPTALIAAWLGSTTLALYLNSSQLLIGFDGGYMLNVAQRQFAWHIPLLSASIDWFQGLGDLFFTVNFRLLPSFIAASFFTDITVQKVVIYEVVLCELSLSIVLFAISLGASRSIAVAAALVTCLTFMPFAAPTLIYSILPLAPYIGSLVACSLLIGAAFLCFGRRSWLADLPYALIVFALLVWSVLVSITTTLLAAPFLLLCAASGMIAASSSAERRRKIWLFAVVAIFLALAGPGLYLISIILDTAAVIFPEELANNRASFYFASILFHWDYGTVGPILVILGVAGAVIAAFDKSRRTLRIFAITLLTYLGTRLTFAALIIEFDFWRGPAPLYFEFFVIPVYAVFAALFCARLFERIWRLCGLSPLRDHIVEIQQVALAVAIMFMLVLAIPFAREDYGFPYPPRPNQITDILSRETGLGLGSEFRGRSIDMIGRTVDQPLNWSNLHALDNSLASETGNELRFVGLHYFGIPGFFEYTPTISPFFYVVASRLLAAPGDEQMRNVIVLRDINRNALAMLGVRFVVTDSLYDGAATLRATTTTQCCDLLLYDIWNPNVGNYSPTVVHKANTASEAIVRLSDPKFDATREVVADLSSDTSNLVPAKTASLRFDGASLRTRAESDGWSILLLPLEFSRCLDVVAAEGSQPVLFRANLVETGILFHSHLDATLSVRTGPFLNSACRLRDFFDARALHVQDVPPRKRSN